MLNVTSSFVDYRSPSGLTIHQVSEEPEGATLIYPDQPSFLPGGRHFVYHGSSGPMLCDLDTLESSPFLREAGKHLIFSPGGRFALWHWEDEAHPDRLELRRYDVDSGRVETVFAADRNLPGTSIPANRFSLRAVAGDGRHVAATCWLGDGKTEDAPFGIVSLDLEAGSACLVAEDSSFVNTHLQYCRCQDEEVARDLLVQMNHGARSDATGKTTAFLGPPADGGVDVHVVRDDGANWRDLPWGRDGRESCIGHQIWRGALRSAVTVTLQNMDGSYGWADGTRQEVVAGWPVPADMSAPHRGRTGRPDQRVLLSEGFRHSRFCHLACDESGLRLVLDTFPIFDGERAGMQLYIAAAPDERTPLAFRYLLNTGIILNPNNGYHAHPILSPDGSVALFNSNLLGTRQVYLVTGFNYPAP